MKIKLHIVKLAILKANFESNRAESNQFDFVTVNRT